MEQGAYCQCDEELRHIGWPSLDHHWEVGASSNFCFRFTVESLLASWCSAGLDRNDKCTYSARQITLAHTFAP